MPIIETKGAASSQGFGQFARASAPVYIEDVFSTYLYTGNGSTQTITNGVDLSGKGGLVWMKGRSAATNHALYDTARGATFDLASNTTGSQSTQSTGLTSFGSTGFSIGSLAKINTNAGTYASWTFRKQPKFFDMVTYTGNGANRTIAHSLGSVPGCIIIKRTDTTGDWQVYHRSLANTEYMVLNSTAAKATGTTRWNSTTPTAGVFSLGTDATVNASGGTYVAYLFAHDAGGFGLTGTDNVISCGSFTTNASPGTASVTLGWEPQWVMRKTASSATNGWEIIDNMRGMLASPNNSPFLRADSDLDESSLGTRGQFPDATGFSVTGSPSTTYVYIAIRRGPMKVPTSGTSVFNPASFLGTGSYPITVNSLSVSDLAIIKEQTTGGSGNVYDRLRDTRLLTNSASVEASAPGWALGQSGITIGNAINDLNKYYATWLFRRAPGFFDIVCYTGTGTQTTISHNLAAVPELLIIKTRNANGPDWMTYTFSTGVSNFLTLNQSSSTTADNLLWVSTPTSTVFTIPGSAPVYDSYINASGSLYVAYLFASCPGVSKVGSYTGTGTTQQINCGFTGGARFVLIKRTDSTGDWYVWDSARGIVAGNDPYLLLNNTAAEVTSTDYIDTLSTGFEISSTAPAAINANGGTFVFLAIS
jgi:hypothetical protein